MIFVGYSRRALVAEKNVPMKAAGDLTNDASGFVSRIHRFYHCLSMAIAVAVVAVAVVAAAVLVAFVVGFVFVIAIVVVAAAVVGEAAGQNPVNGDFPSPQYHL